MLTTDRWHPEAEAEFWQRLEYQNLFYPAQAQQWLDTIKNSVATILEDPERHREREFGHRRVNLGDFPHYLAYIIRKDSVWFVAVGSGSQREFYWKSRLEE